MLPCRFVARRRRGIKRCLQLRDKVGRLVSVRIQSVGGISVTVRVIWRGRSFWGTRVGAHACLTSGPSSSEAVACP
jgi:hypothetical protein